MSAGQRESSWFSRIVRGRLDLLAVAILILASLAVRIGSLDRVALNPDESQYEATASYLEATGRSAFSLPYLIAGTLTVYKAVALVFGPYAMEPIRILVLLLVTGVALVLYDLLRCRAGVWPALLAGLVFLYWNPAFEGLSANREWFATPLLLLGLWCWSSAPKRGAQRRVWIVAAGLLSALAPAFKAQAAPIALALPAAIWFTSPSTVEDGSRRRDLGYWVLGAAVAGGIYLGAFVFAGGLGGFVEAVRTFAVSYLPGGTAPRSSGATESFAFHLLLGIAHRPLLLAGYTMALFTLVGDTLRRVRGQGGGDPVTMALSLQLVAAIVAVSAGGRFFPHYYLFLLPPLAGLVGLAVHRVSASQPAPGGRAFNWTLGGLLALDAAWRLSRAPFAPAEEPWASAVPSIAYWIIFVGLLAWWAYDSLGSGRRALVGLIVLETALLSFQVQLTVPPRSLPFHRQGFEQLLQVLHDRGGPGDRLFVWGWAPEIYSLSRLEAASHLTICQYLVGDYTSVPGPAAIDPRFDEMLMRDLTDRKPRFIVDAWRRSWTFAEPPHPSPYRLDLYPDFALRRLIDDEYALVGRFDDCDLYERRDGTGASFPPG